MLVLTRRRDGRICIPDLGVEILVVDIIGNKVKLGVKAPAEAAIFRGEILEAKEEAKCSRTMRG